MIKGCFVVAFHLIHSLVYNQRFLSRIDLPSIDTHALTDHGWGKYSSFAIPEKYAPSLAGPSGSADARQWEEAQLFEQSNKDVSTVVNGKAVYATSIDGFLCPSRPNAGTVAATTNGGANKWAIGNYAGNFFVFGDRNVLSTEGKTRLAMLPDGLSQTCMFTERYGTCGNSGQPNDSSTWGNLWADSNLRWRPHFCMNGE